MPATRFSSAKEVPNSKSDLALAILIARDLIDLGRYEDAAGMLTLALRWSGIPMDQLKKRQQRIHAIGVVEACGGSGTQTRDCLRNAAAIEGAVQ